MTATISHINTPKGGTPTYVMLIGLRDEIIGSIIFKSEKDANDFKETMKPLLEKDFGFLELGVDAD